MSIVEACLRYPEGLEELIDRVAFLEGNSEPMRQLEKLLRFIFFEPYPPIISQELFGELLEIITEVDVDRNDLLDMYQRSVHSLWPTSDIRGHDNDEMLARMVRQLTETDPNSKKTWPLLTFVRLLERHIEPPDQKSQFEAWREKAARTVGVDEQNSHREEMALVTPISEASFRLLANASPPALTLAGLLATVPVSMPVVRHIQQTMLPNSHNRHVEEIFQSGMLKVISENSEQLNPDYVQYDFVDGIREDLLEIVPASDKARALIKITDYIERNYNQMLDFKRLIAYPQSRKGVFIGQESRPFAMTAARVLRRFGGKYVALADWIEEQADIRDITSSAVPYLATQTITTEIDYVKQEIKAPVENGVPDKQEEAVLADTPSSPPKTPTDTPDLSGNTLSFIDPQAIPQPEPIINQNIQPKTYICPSCFEEIHIGDCRIVSGKTPGTVLKEAPAGWWERQMARSNPERLDTPLYMQESAHRECHECGYLLPYNIDHVASITLAVIGDTSAGKSLYIASLLHQIQEEWMVHAEGYAQLTCLTPEVEAMYVQNYIEPLFKDKKILLPTRPEEYPSEQMESTTVLKATPLIYELSMLSSPDTQPTAINFLIYDVSGENYESEKRLVQFARFVFNTGAFVFTVDPVRIMPVFQQLPPQLQANLQAVVNLAAEQRTADRINTIIPLYESYYGYTEGSSLPFTPIAIMVSKADLLKYLHLPSSSTLMKNPQYRGSVDLRDLDKVDQEVRELLKTYGQGDIFAATRRFKRVKFFATSATGEPPDANGQFENVEPCRCLDPLLWILYEFGLIKASV